MKGIIAGNFDIIHPGYVKMFNDINKHVKKIHVLLHVDPSLDRPEKLKPLISVKDRTMTLLALKGVVNVSTYNDENELKQLIIDINPEIRFLGDDYISRTNYTGYGLPPKIVFLERNHGWSTTKFKNLIASSIINNSKKEK